MFSDMPAAHTATRRLIELKLGRDLEQVCREKALSWRGLADYIARETDVVVSHESLRTWLSAAPTSKAGAA